MIALDELMRERGLTLPEGVAGTAAAPRAQLLASLPPEIAPYAQEGIATRSHVILIGAGGVGARLAPLLIKHLIAGDALTILDHDIVEQKNLLRQHFIESDIGKAKAIVVAARAEAAAPVPGIIVSAVQMKVEARRALQAVCPYHDLANAPWTMPSPPNGLQLQYRTIVVSAIDSRKGRRDIAAAVTILSKPYAWIDCGNDTNTGQALVARVNMIMTIRQAGEKAADAMNEHVYFDGWQALAPEFLNTEDAPEEVNCAVRLDTQSVGANVWAATTAMTLAVPFITGAAITSLGIAFSIKSGATRVSMVQGCDYNRDEGVYKIKTSRLLA